MRTFLITAFTAILHFSCTNSNNLQEEVQLSAYELEDKSLETGIKKDTLYLGFQIGNSHHEYIKHIELLQSKGQVYLEDDSAIVSTLETKNYKYFTRSRFYFENGKLYRCVNHIYPSESEKINEEAVDMRSDLLTLFDNLYKTDRKSNGTQNSEFYWLLGNRRTDFYDTLDRYIIAQSDIKTEREIDERIKNAPKEYSIIQSVEIFKERFNLFAKEVNFSYKIKKINVLEGKVNNVFTYMFNTHIGISGQVNKSNNSLRSITMMAQGDGSAKSGLDIIIVMGAIISASNPELTPSERGSILKELGILGDDIDLSNLSSTVIKNDVKYFANANEVIGITFGAQSKYDE